MIELLQTEVDLPYIKTFPLNLNIKKARVQEQVLEMLPMISEVNAVSEELNKYRHFELILLGAATQDDNETKLDFNS